MAKTKRVLIVTFDALRPDMVTAELMPNLKAFAEESCFIANARAVFPTETRVNQAALVSGCYPAQNGIVGNKFLDPIAAPGRLFNTGDPEQLAEGDDRLQGKLVGRPVLGEILHQAGRNLAVVSGGTPGGTRMLHHKAEVCGGFRFSLHRPDVSTPHDKIAALIDKLGPIPPHTIPSLAWLDYVADCYIHYIDPVVNPAVTVLWFPEPDNSYHQKGIGSPDNLKALVHLDRVFARLLAHCRPALDAGDLHLLTLSDHGQIAIEERPIGLKQQMQQAGFAVGTHTGGAHPADVALALDSAGGIYIRDKDPDLHTRVLDWLFQQDWCGPLFTHTGTRTLRHDQIQLTHPRAGDIMMVFAADHAVNRHGFPGSTRHDAPYPLGGGTHGGLNAIELNNWMAFAGSAFRQAHKSQIPAGLCDLLPTVLDLLDLPVPSTMDGRILRECLDTGRTAPQVTQHEVHAEGNFGHRSFLHYSEVEGRRYLNRAWAERHA